MIMIAAVAAVSLILAVIMDARIDSGTVVVTRTQRDALYMIMMLSLILLTGQVAMIMA